ncbi:MAG: carboxymuconolactone decarboxylase family protein [Desulfobacteraceae bacterium]
MSSERYERGWKQLVTVVGDGGERVIESLQGIAPDVGKHIVEFAFGDIYCRPGLNLKQRQLVTIGSLTSLGGSEPQLSGHINAALNVGLTPDEIVEAIMHCSPFVGFPRVVNALALAKNIFEKRGVVFNRQNDHEDE